MVKQSQVTIKVATTRQADDIVKINASNIVAMLKDKTMDEGTRIAILEQVMPTSFTAGATLTTILNTLKLKSIYFSMKNFVRVKFPLMHYCGQVEEEALHNSGATENFIDSNTVKRLKLGIKKLGLQRLVYNVDGTPNKHGTITHACDLLVKQGNKRERLRFYVSNLGKDRFIFGYPWFRKFNPNIDWENAKLRGPQVKVETIQHNAKLCAFDSTIFVIGPTHKIATDCAASAYRSVMEWLTRNGLGIDMDKTEYTSFKPPRALSHHVGT